MSPVYLSLASYDFSQQAPSEDTSLMRQGRCPLRLVKLFEVVIQPNMVRCIDVNCDSS